MSRRRLVFLACTLGLLLLLPAPARAAPIQRGWSYAIRVDEALAQMHVRICFQRYLPRQLILNQPEAAHALVFPETQPGGVRLEQAADGRSWRPVGLRDGGCIDYVVDLRALAGRRGRTASFQGRDLVAAPGALFLRPTRWTRDLVVTATFELPSGYRPAVPWPQRSDGHYTIDSLAFQLLGEIAIGRFPPSTLQLSGAQVDIAVFEGRLQATTAGIRTWIAAAVSAVADLYGRFPMPHLTVLVRPTPSRGEPVAFGLSMRAGGGHAKLLLSSLARDEDLPGEWVAVHEFIHLGLPWTYDQEAWFQEGFVTYYQEVLRGRAGFHSERKAWQLMEEGFQRGRSRGGDQPLESESRTMRRDHNYRRVYWAGAAIAFLIDVELRRLSGGTQSLDDVMRIIHARFGAAPKPHGGLDLLRAADRALGRSVAAPIAERMLLRRAFPDLSAVYQALGIRVVGRRVELDDAAPQAELRKAIMRAGGR